MIKCKAYPKKGGIAVMVKGNHLQLAVETLAAVKAVVSYKVSGERRQALIDGIRRMLDDLEEAAAETEENAD